jgi:Arc/MetJ-type ribon-helix-helix transcriptional regulator
MTDAARSGGRVIGSKISAVELVQIKKLVASGVYSNTSDFFRDAVRDKLAAIKIIKYRNVDYETAKKEVMGYFQEKGEAYASEIEEDLELDYELICQDRGRAGARGTPGGALMGCHDVGEYLHGFRIRSVGQEDLTTKGFSQNRKVQGQDVDLNSRT